MDRVSKGSDANLWFVIGEASKKLKEMSQEARDATEALGDAQAAALTAKRHLTFDARMFEIGESVHTTIQKLVADILAAARQAKSGGGKNAGGNGAGSGANGGAGSSPKGRIGQQAPGAQTGSNNPWMQRVEPKAMIQGQLGIIGQIWQAAEGGSAKKGRMSGQQAGQMGGQAAAQQVSSVLGSFAEAEHDAAGRMDEMAKRAAQAAKGAKRREKNADAHADRLRSVALQLQDFA